MPILILTKPLGCRLSTEIALRPPVVQVTVLEEWLPLRSQGEYKGKGTPAHTLQRTSDTGNRSSVRPASVSSSVKWTAAKVKGFATETQAASFCSQKAALSEENSGRVRNWLLPTLHSGSSR